LRARGEKEGRERGRKRPSCRPTAPRKISSQRRGRPGGGGGGGGAPIPSRKRGRRGGRGKKGDHLSFLRSDVSRGRPIFRPLTKKRRIRGSGEEKEGPRQHRLLLTRGKREKRGRRLTLRLVGAKKASPVSHTRGVARKPICGKKGRGSGTKLRRGNPLFLSNGGGKRGKELIFYLILRRSLHEPIRKGGGKRSGRGRTLPVCPAKRKGGKKRGVKVPPIFIRRRRRERQG